MADNSRPDGTAPDAADEAAGCCGCVVALALIIVVLCGAVACGWRLLAWGGVVS